MFNPATGQDDPNYDPNGYTDPNTGQPSTGASAAQAPGGAGAATNQPGANGVGAPGNMSDQVSGYYGKYLGRQANPNEVSGWVNGGLDLPTIENAIANSQEADNYNKANKLGKYAPGPAAPPAQPGAPAPGMPLGNVFGGVGSLTGGNFPGTTITQDPRFSDLVTTLLGRANNSLNIDPATDSVIRPQVDNYAAQQERQRRTYLNQVAESSSPYQTGALQNAATQTAEAAGTNTANLQSSLMNNELTARRGEIQNALSEAGSLLTGNQQMALQQELGQLDAQLKQQSISSQNDQFLAQLGLNAQNQGNYWDSLRSGLIHG